MEAPLRLRWRMSCFGPVTAERTPAVVRPTVGACVPSLCWLLGSSLDVCLRVTTNAIGSCTSQMWAFVARPPMVSRVNLKAFTALPHVAGQTSFIKATSCMLLDSDVANCKGRWCFGTSFLPKGSPNGNNDR